MPSMVPVGDMSDANEEDVNNALLRREGPPPPVGLRAINIVPAGSADSRPPGIVWKKTRVVLWVQIVKGNSATAAGLKLIPLMMGIVTMSIFSGKRITTTGKYKIYPVLGTAVMTVGILLMTLLTRFTPYWQLSIFAIIVGAGLGLSMQTIVIAIQNAVDFSDMGVATSSNTFFRSLGSVFGSAIFGAVLNNRLTHYMQSGFTNLAAQNPESVAGVNFSSNGITSIITNPRHYSTLVHNTALDAYVNAFHVVFFAAVPITALGFILALMLRELPLRTHHDYATAREEAAGEVFG